MKVLVCGDRYWSNYQVIYNRLKSLSPDTVIIEGEAKGADTLARRAGEALGFEIQCFPADWNKYGKGAGPVRNAQMLDECPDEVWAFHNDINNSKGTKNCITQARKRGIKVRVFTE